MKCCYICLHYKSACDKAIGFSDDFAKTKKSKVCSNWIHPTFSRLSGIIRGSSPRIVVFYCCPGFRSLVESGNISAELVKTELVYSLPELPNITHCPYCGQLVKEKFD